MNGDALEKYPDSALKRAMVKRKLSIRGLAKLLAGSDDPRRIDTQRTAVKRWLDPDRGISPRSATRLAPHLGQPAETLHRQGKKAVRQSALLEQVAARVERQAKTIERLSARVRKLEEAAQPQRDTRRRAQGDA